VDLSDMQLLLLIELLQSKPERLSGPVVIAAHKQHASCCRARPVDVFVSVCV